MGMPRLVTLVVLSCIMLCCINFSEAWRDKPKSIHIEGKVLCQDCTGGWNDWVKGAKPIKGSRVSATCMDERGKVIYYGSDETDEEGEFDMVVDSREVCKELRPELCSVRLVSSPNPICNVATDFGGGKSGVKLSRPSFVYRDLVKYRPDPFYYTSPMCEEPDTTEAQEDQEANYYFYKKETTY
ncbi:hypothetical protein Scep_005305 [Stephania cephalantha]|uniref:Uncharacterized protein n=1 Tax=Stephania cephalantha TaxID=152367 RepID=A0AAP0KUA9_9MAGN